MDDESEEEKVGGGSDISEELVEITNDNSNVEENELDCESDEEQGLHENFEETTNYFLTCDIRYTRRSLLRNFLKYKITMIAILRRNKRELLPDFLPNMERELVSSLLFLDFTMTAL